MNTNSTRTPLGQLACGGPLRLSELARLGWYAQAAYNAQGIAVDLADSATNTLARVFVNPGEVVIALRGTENMKNWLLDLDIRKVPLRGRAEVHAGFLRGANALLPLIVDALLPAGASKLKLPPISIVGHSLGGSMAKLIALALHDQGFDILDVVTFANPRVGNRAWRELYNAALGDNTLRVVAAGDLIPLLPGVLDGYRHVGQEIYLDGKVWLNPSRIAEILGDSWRAWNALRRCDLDFLLEFHSMERDYLRLLAGPAGAMRETP